LAKVNLDPAVASMLKGASENRSALTRKQKTDRKRIRVKYDLDPALKGAIEREAKRIGTSASQYAAFLLEFAAKEARAGNAEIIEAVANGKSESATMKFEWNLDSPKSWRIVHDGDNQRGQ
jgi:NADPH-dependent glutamate synthase beta subunit-like oxidoreductase